MSYIETSDEVLDQGEQEIQDVHDVPEDEV
jgi:hypothetical protein